MPITFEGSLQALERDLGKRVKAETKALAIQLHELIMKDYPVYTGKTLGSWAWSVNVYPTQAPYAGGKRPSAGQRGEFNRSSAEGKSRATQSVLNTGDDYNVFILGNNAYGVVEGSKYPMAYAIEFGLPWSGRNKPQQPNVRTAIAKVRKK